MDHITGDQPSVAAFMVAEARVRMDDTSKPEAVTDIRSGGVCPTE